MILKKLFVILSLMGLSTLVGAQGNLQFNRVLTYNGTLSINPYQGSGQMVYSPEWIVPQGRVWKVENKTITPNGGIAFYVNGSIFSDLVSSGSYQMIHNPRPFWLKSGDVIKFSASFSAVGGQVDYFISIIEFNIIEQ